jgi:hypothetical protein
LLVEHYRRKFADPKNFRYGGGVTGEETGAPEAAVSNVRNKV